MATTIAIAQGDYPELTKKGWKMYRYDMACWIATDTVMSLRPEASQMGWYFAKEQDSRWLVTFGRLSDDRTAFMIAYEVTLDAGVIKTVVHFTPASRDTDYYLKLGKAADACGRQFVPPLPCPFNLIVLQEIDRTWSLYFVPSLMSKDTIALGADTRFAVSEDGSTLLESTELHKTLLRIPQRSNGVVKPEYAMHMHILNDQPVETDVFYVLRGIPLIEHYIGTLHRRFFRIDTTGSIHDVSKFFNE